MNIKGYTNKNVKVSFELFTIKGRIMSKNKVIVAVAALLSLAGIAIIVMILTIIGSQFQGVFADMGTDEETPEVDIYEFTPGTKYAVYTPYKDDKVIVNEINSAGENNERKFKELSLNEVLSYGEIKQQYFENFNISLMDYNTKYEFNINESKLEKLTNEEDETETSGVFFNCTNCAEPVSLSSKYDAEYGDRIEQICNIDQTECAELPEIVDVYNVDEIAQSEGNYFVASTDYESEAGMTGTIDVFDSNYQYVTRLELGEIYREMVLINEEDRAFLVTNLQVNDTNKLIFNELKLVDGEIEMTEVAKLAGNEIAQVSPYIDGKSVYYIENDMYRNIPVTLDLTGDTISANEIGVSRNEILNIEVGYRLPNGNHLIYVTLDDEYDYSVTHLIEIIEYNIENKEEIDVVDTIDLGIENPQLVVKVEE